MHLNEIADSLEPRDMTLTDEFGSLLTSASELGIPHSPRVRYRSRQTVVRHTRFHFLEWGDDGAPPLLLLHGGNQTAHSWDLVSLHLADRYHVYALDQRGHGDSEWVRDQDYGSEAMAADALAFMAQQGIARPVIMGHSMGGRNTMQLAVAHPALARGLVFVDIGPETAPEGGRPIRDFITANVEFDSVDEFVDRVQAYDRLRSRAHMERTARYNLFRRADGKFVSKADRVLHGSGRFAAGRDGGPGGGGTVTQAAPAVPRRATASPVTLEQVKLIQSPSLVVRGGLSTLFPQELAQAFADALPNGRWVEVPRAGHNVHSQNTPGFLDAVRPFLAALPA